MTEEEVSSHRLCFVQDSKLDYSLHSEHRKQVPFCLMPVPSREIFAAVSNWKVVLAKQKFLCLSQVPYLMSILCWLFNSF